MRIAAALALPWPGPRPAGSPRRPLVQDENTARAIFLAVERTANPHADADAFPLVVAQERGDHWRVFRASEPKKVGADLLMSQGGGQLSSMSPSAMARFQNVALGR